MNNTQDFSTGDDLLNFLGQAPKETTNELENLLQTPPKSEETPKEVTEEKVEEVAVETSPQVQAEGLKDIADILPTQPQTSATKNDLVKRYLEDGYWQDVTVQIQTEEGLKEVSLSEMDNVDEETFSQLKEAQDKLRTEEFDQKFISKEGLDEKTLKLIEIARNGRFDEIQDLLKIQTEIVHPLQGLDTSDEKVQEWIVAQTLKNQGADDIVISNTIKQYKENLILDQKAEAVVQQIDRMYNEQVDNKLKEVEEAKIKEKENQKLFKKSVSDEYKKLGIKETLQKSLIESATKYDEFGLSQTDKLYFEAKKDPQFFADLNFFLNNRDAYNEFKGVKIANEVNKRNFITIVKSDKKVASTLVETKKDDSKENPLNRFLNTN